MSLHTIKSIDGNEYVLLPVDTYRLLKKQIDTVVDDEYVPFRIEDYVKNPIALARMKAHLTQEELAKDLNVSQAYISKIEKDGTRISSKLLSKVMGAIELHESILECEEMIRADKGPNKETIKVFNETDKGTGLVKCKNTKELFKNLGI